MMVEVYPYSQDEAVIDTVGIFGLGISRTTECLWEEPSVQGEVSSMLALVDMARLTDRARFVACFWGESGSRRRTITETVLRR